MDAETKNEDVREFENALISIRGNSLRYKNSVFSLHNIVSLTFDSVRRERTKPYDITEYYGYSKWWVKYFFFTTIATIAFVSFAEMGFYSAKGIESWLIDTFELRPSTLKAVLQYFFISVALALPMSILTFLIAKYKSWSYNSYRYYYVNGLRIIFVNNMILYFIGNNDSGFIEDTLRGIESFIAEPMGSTSKAMSINFSDNSIKIDEVSNSNVVGGNVSGGIYSGE